MDNLNSWWNSFVATTGGKYLLTIVTTWIAAHLGLDPTQGPSQVLGLISALVAVASAVWGMYESSRAKVVVAGTKVALDQMPPADKAAVAQIVAKNTGA